MPPFILFIIGGSRTRDFGGDILWLHWYFVRHFKLWCVVSVDTISQSLLFLSWYLW